MKIVRSVALLLALALPSMAFASDCPCGEKCPCPDCPCH